MRRLLTLCLAALALPVALVAAADDKDTKPKVNFKDHVAPIFQARCNGCHNGDQQKGGLVLESFGGSIKGGSSGTVVEPGDPDNSRLYLMVTHQEEPKMPPNAPKLPDAELATIKAWIEAGAPEASGSVVVMNKPKTSLKLDPGAVGKPAGSPALPEELSTEVLVASPRPNAVTALATSPWAPLVAISGHKQVLLYRTDTGRLAAVLPFPEGTIHSLKFSRDGAILLVAGGRGAREGKAIGFDVKTGERLFEIGKEYDIVLAADLSPDRSLVALGGPSKLLRVYNTSDGEIAYESKKHTDWITAVAFSPDGVLLASGDRNGGLIVWESGTGREFHDLRGHTAMVTDLSWRIDSNLLASASEDTTVRLWEMENGGQVKSWGAHGAGAESVSFGKDGRLVTVGRDRVPKLWDGNGAEQKQFEAFPDVATRVAFTHDDQGVVAADWSGEVRLYQTGDGKALARFVTNPAPLAQRLVAADGAVRAAEAAVVQAQKELGPLDGGVATSKATFDQAAAKVQGAEAKSAEVATALQALEAEIAAKEASAKVARDLVAKVQAAEAAAVQLKAEADQAVAKAAEVKKLAVERAAASKSEPDLMLAAEAEKAHIGAVRFATTLEAQVLASRAAISPAQAAAASAEAIRGLVAAPLEARKAAVAEAGKAVETEKAGLAAAQAAHEAASKALAEKQAAITALQAQAAQAKALADELAAEVKRHAASPGVASTAEGKPPTSQ